MNEQSPAICVDIKRRRIRIHKNTLRAIGNPEYILLLVNPEESSVALMRGSRTDPKAHRVKYNMKNRNSYELCSLSLLQKLQTICNDWKGIGAYRIQGEIIRNGEAVLFDMSNAVLISGESQ